MTGKRNRIKLENVRALLSALDPVRFARKLGFTPDPHQTERLLCDSRAREFVRRTEGFVRKRGCKMRGDGDNGRGHIAVPALVPLLHPS